MIRLPAVPSLVLAPAAGGVLAAVGTMACYFVGISWNHLSAALLAAVTIGVCALIGKLINAPLEPAGRTPNFLKLLVAAGLSCTALIIGWVMFDAMNSLDRVSQAWDPTYHVNVLQWIKDNGQASPWSIWPIFGGAPPSFYPSGWHAMVSLVPGDVVVAGNLACMVVSCLVWPTSLCLLARALFPRQPVVWILTPLLASSMLAFPFIQLSRSGQWPNSFATALLPAVLALGIEMQYRSQMAWTADSELEGRHMLRRTVASRRGTLARLAALLIATAGVIWIHPSSLFALVALGGIYMARFVVLWCRGIWMRNRTLGIGVTAGLIMAMTAGAYVLARSDVLAGVMSYPRPPSSGWAEALAWVFFDLPRQPDSAVSTPASYSIIVGILMIAGALLACLVPRARPAVAGMAAALLLFILAAGPERPFRWLSGFWYKDPPRLLPLVLIFGCVFAAFALTQACRTLLVAVRPPLQHREGLRHSLCIGVAVAVLTAVFATSSGFRYDVRVAAAAEPYLVTPHPPGRGLMYDEQEFIKSLKPLLPQDAVVIGDPFNGLPYLYSLTGHEVVFFQMVSNAGSTDKHYLRHHFHEINENPRVCAALQRIGATHLYDDRPVRAHQQNDDRRWTGFQDIDISTGFREIASHGTAALYEITACDRQPTPGTG